MHSFRLAVAFLEFPSPCLLTLLKGSIHRINIRLFGYIHRVKPRRRLLKGAAEPLQPLQVEIQNARILDEESIGGVTGSTDD